MQPNIIHAFDAEGGFYAANTETGQIAYAYPTSPNATKARKAPDAIATKMASRARILPEFDAYKWAQLRKLVGEAAQRP